MSEEKANTKDFDRLAEEYAKKLGISEKFKTKEGRRLAEEHAKDLGCSVDEFIELAKKLALLHKWHAQGVTELKLKCGHTVKRWNVFKNKTNEHYCKICKKIVPKARS